MDAKVYAAKMVDEAVELLQREATEIANQHHEVMLGMTERDAADYVKRVIADAPLVFGVYQDAGSPNGVGMYVIKGKRELLASVAAGLPIQIRSTPSPASNANRPWQPRKYTATGRSRAMAKR